MKITHVISSIDKNAGGTTTALYDLLKAQSKLLDVHLLTLPSEKPMDFNFEGILLNFEKPLFLNYSPGLNKKLTSSDSDLFHGHALWNLPMHQMADVAGRIKKPYIISIHGMLHPWALSNKNLKKRIALFLYQRRDLIRANCLHATSYIEAQYIRDQGYRNPIAVIPNGIDPNDYPLSGKHMIKEKHINSAKRRILYLSRVHHQKGIELLIEAWKEVPSNLKSNWIVDIMGNGTESYIKFLSKKIEELGLSEQIRVIGPVYGKEKIEAYHNADLFVLPSYSENFGMVIAEALSCGVPVITTKGTPWSDLEKRNCGIWADANLDTLSSAIKTMLQKSDEERIIMGLNGRLLIEEQYSIASVAEKFVSLYRWLLKMNKKPDFII